MLRLSFLWRFTLVTLAVSALSAVVLASTMERAHRAAIETDVEISALAHISAELTLPLDRLASLGAQASAVQQSLAHVNDDAQLFEYVVGMRVYTPSGKAVFPASAPSAMSEVHAALAADNFYRIDRGDRITVYSPCYTHNETVFVIAVDFGRGQLSAAYLRERNELLRVVGTVSAISFISLITLAAGASRELERRRREAQSTFVHTLTIMAEVIDLRDPYTAGHSQRVAAYSRQLAAAIGLHAREVEVIESGALLHDIGKIGIPDAVLFKPAALDAEERRIISEHPRVGARLLAGIAAMQDVVPCVMHHHEKLDGSGYPDRLAGEAIPLGARVVAVADTFDAMTTDRPYRNALSAQTAVAELRRVAGTQLDVRLVDAFIILVASGAIVPPPSLAAAAAAARESAHVDPERRFAGAGHPGMQEMVAGPHAG